MNNLIKEVYIDGVAYSLAYTVRAMIDINRLLKQEDGESIELIQVILGDDLKNFELFAEIIEVLNYSGELLRTSRGMEKGNYINSEKIIAMLSPKELLELKKGAMQAILAGLGREEETEVDLGLAEIEKKNLHQKQK